ncbi:MAG: antibiotic biosynthesis monooxygenase [Dehalococcoidia bacterium]|nr:antibiotic biosynthesis monooxygenase [Dehalococcoidia bacterium]
MSYIRLSVARPRHGQEARLEDLMRKLDDLSKDQDGCIESFVLKPHDDSGEIARIVVYRDENAAEAAANSQSFLAIRSEIHLVSEPGQVERAFFSI